MIADNNQLSDCDQKLIEASPIHNISIHFNILGFSFQLINMFIKIATLTKSCCKVKVISYCYN